MGDRLQLCDLVVRAGARTLVAGVSLCVEKGRIVGLLGESGAGKTLTSRALLGLVDLDPGVVGGELLVVIDGVEHRPYASIASSGRAARDRAFAAIRGEAIGYLPQDARHALDPLLTVGQQVSLAARLRAGLRPDPSPWLRRAGFPNPDGVASLFPHEISGGMAQRAVIAQALARGSRFLVADEPTTGIDPSARGAVLDELRRLADEGMGILLVTHHVRVLWTVADAVVIVDGGRSVEELPATAMRPGGPKSEVGRRLVAATELLGAGRPR